MIPFTILKKILIFNMVYGLFISKHHCSHFQWEQGRPVEKQLKRLPAAKLQQLQLATCSLQQTPAVWNRWSGARFWRMALWPRES